MPDSIFDLKQTLFTSNLPAPTSRDRGSDKVSNFDQALNSAQRQSHDEQRANNTPETPATSNQASDDVEQTDDAPREEQDEVTLTKHASETAHTQPTEPIKGKKPKTGETKASDEKKEPTAEELAAAATAPQAPAKPVLKQLPEGDANSGEQHEGIELNDAVQPGAKQRTLKPTDKQQLATTVPEDALSNKQSETPATATTVAVTDATPVDPNAVVVATELHATKTANVKKFDAKGANKPGADKTSSVDSKHTAEQTETTAEGRFNEGAFAVSVTPAAEGDAPAPKRRLETTRQALPEVHDAPLQAAASLTINAAATASAASPEATADLTTTTAKAPEIPTVSPNSSETPPPSNHLRGPQIPGSFANRLEAAAAERKANDGLNGVDRTRFVQRVARAFQRVGETEGEIRLRLSPPELGAVKLEVALRDGAMVARMETETTTARNLLMENLPQLKERLAEQNIRIETFEVEVRDQTRQDSAEDAKEQLRQQQDTQRNRLRGERATAPVVAAPIVQTLSAARQSSQLNIII